MACVARKTECLRGAPRPDGRTHRSAEGGVSLKQNEDVAIASFRLIETGDPILADEIIASDFVNREAEDDPEQEDRKAKGADGFLATSSWLRAAFADLRFEVIEGSRKTTASPCGRR